MAETVQATEAEKPADDAPVVQVLQHGPKTRHTPPHDVAKEQYKGPGVAAATAGEGFIAHYKWGGIGAVTAGGLSYIFYKPVGEVVEKIRKYSNGIRGDVGFPKSAIRWTLHFVFGTGPKKQEHFLEAIEHCTNKFTEGEKAAFHGWVSRRELGFGYGILHHIPGARGYLDKLIKAAEASPGDVTLFARASRASTAISVGGVAGLAGLLLMPFIVAPRGFRRGSEGRSQFERAKDEIWTQRAEYDALREKYLNNAVELEDLRAREASGTNRDDATETNETTTDVKPIEPTLAKDPVTAEQTPTLETTDTKPADAPTTTPVSRASTHYEPGDRPIAGDKVEQAPSNTVSAKSVARDVSALSKQTEAALA